MNSSRRKTRAAAMTVAITTAVATTLGTGSTAASAKTTLGRPHTVGIVARGDQYTLDTTAVRAGLVRLRMRNTDPSEYESAAVARLADSAAQEEFLSLLNSANPYAAFGLLEFVGGPNATAPGHVATTLADLNQGRYVVLNFLDDADGVPKVFKGMLSWFDVVGTANRHDPPRVDGTFESYDHGFDVPPVVKRSGVYRYVNTTPGEVHELGFVRLAPGKTFADFTAWVRGGMTGPEPGVLAEGSTAVASTARVWVVVHLPPGDYVAASWIADQATGVRQVALGEMTPFTIA